MEKIGVLTSGGDAPGLNAALHAIVVTANQRNVSVMGFNDGYDGLIDGQCIELDLQTVRNIMNEGGTILRTSRSKRFFQAKWRKKALAQLQRHEIDGLLIIGGNGSLEGAGKFEHEGGFPIIGIPKTIDNDIPCTDYSIGFDTAANTVVQAVDKIKDTADSTSRIFIVEVMGRKAGFLALHAGIAVAANGIIIPEIKPNIDGLLDSIEHNWRNGNHSMIILATENSVPGGTLRLKKIIDNRFPESDSRVSILGHIQRGGNPSAFDRTLASFLAYNATNALIKGRKGKVVGMINGKIKFQLLEKAAKHHKINPLLLKMADEFTILI